MRSTLKSMKKKERRPRMRESSAEEWQSIIEKADIERIEFCSTAIEKDLDEENEPTGLELEDEVELESTRVISKRKRTARYIKTFGSLQKERLSSDSDMLYFIQSKSTCGSFHMSHFSINTQNLVIGSVSGKISRETDPLNHLISILKPSKV